MTAREFETAVGVTIVFGLWILVSTILSGGDALPVLAAAGLLLVGLVVGLAVPGTASTVVAGGLVVLCVGVFAIFLPSIRAAASPPFGYANANAALFVQGSAAAALLMQHSAGRIKAIARAVLLATGPVLVYMGSIAAVLGWSIVLGGLFACAGGPAMRRVWIGVCMAALACSSLLAFAVGAAGTAGPASDLLSERRVALWSEGWSILQEQPITGVGSRRFVAESPTAGSDPDASEAHAELLQRAAENGLPGAGLEMAAILVPLVVLFRRPHASAPIAASGWTALWVHGGVDYVAAFPGVLLAAALVTGLGTRPAVSVDQVVRTTPRLPS